jgi:hypothetical protein
MAAFGISADFAAQREWMRKFVATEVEPLDLAFGSEGVIYDKTHPVHERVVWRLQDRVRDEGHRFSLADVAEAMRVVHDRRALGKVVIEMPT